MRIVNLTQHSPTREQEQGGVFDLGTDARAEVLRMITFEELPSREDLDTRARRVAEIAAESGAFAAMIGGAPYFQGPLEQALRSQGVHPCYAFSKRESVDQENADGSIRKVSVFRHLGFVFPYPVT